MVTEIIESIMGRWKKKEKDDAKPTVPLNKESLERLERLKAKITAFDTRELVALSLKCLEQKTDRIIKRQVMKKVSVLEDEGYSLQQIAELLNDEGVPAVMERDKWHAEDISRLLNKQRKWNFDDTIRNNQLRNGQGLESNDV